MFTSPSAATTSIPKAFETEARHTRERAAEPTTSVSSESNVQQSLHLKGDGYTTFVNQVNGLPLIMQDAVNSSLKLQQQNISVPITEKLVRQLYNETPAIIQGTLHSYGFFKSTLNSTLTNTNGAWVARTHVVLGPQVRIAHIFINIIGKGTLEAELQNLKRNFPLVSGQPLLIKEYNEAKQKFFDTANRLGYLDAHFSKSNVLVDNDTNNADIILLFDTGSQYYFGPVHFNPDSNYSETFLQRFLFIKPGEPFSSADLMQLQRNFANSNYFKLVAITPERTNMVDHKIPININLTPYKSQQFLVGFGYGTDTGMRGTLGANLRHVTSTGQQFKVIMQGSQIGNSLEARYIFPGTNPLTQQYNVSAGVENATPQGSKSRTEKISVGYTSNSSILQQSIALTYQLDQFSIHSNPTVNTNTFYPSIGWLYIKTQDPMHTTEGGRIGLTLSGANKYLLSDENFIQMQTQAKLIHSFLAGTRMVLNGNFSYTFTKHPQELPLSMRFFAGGAQSVRGYGYQELGPGRILVYSSAELQQKVYGNWYGAVFYDAGNAFDQLGPLRKSVGAAVVWFTPVGPLELSVARPLNDSANKGIRVQFTMGPDL